MNSDILKILLNSLDREAFSRFIYELWHQDDKNDGLTIRETYPLIEISEELFEHNYIQRPSKNSANEYQGFDLIVPYFCPFELFNSPSDILIYHPELKKTLIKYKRLIDERLSEWQFWTDGNYVIPNIKFVTNYANLPHSFYFDILFPRFEKIISDLDIEAQVYVGSCDSFIELNPEGTKQAFKNLIVNSNKDIAITISRETISIEHFETEKYIVSGVLNNSKNPCEPVYIDTEIKKSSIIREFEYLLNNKAKEIELENFIKKYYRQIFGRHYDRIETQLWLKFPNIDISSKNRRIDIFLRNSVERDWELYELKRVKKLTRTHRDIPVFISEIYLAIQQIETYKKLLLQDEVKKKLSLEGIEYYYPEFKLIIGKKPHISLEQWRWLKSSNEKNVKLLTYDDLLSEMKIRLRARGEFEI